MRRSHRAVVSALLGVLVLPLAAQTGPSLLAQNRTGPQSNREDWQRVPDIFAAMGVATGSVVADVGAGNGFLTTRLAKAVGPTGRVYAVDISASALDRLKATVATEGLTNVETILGLVHDPRLPAGVLDAAVIVNAYHEMREHQSMLLAIRRALKPAGRLVIVEAANPGRRGASRQAQETQHSLAPHFLQQDAIAAGYVITRIEDPFTSHGGSSVEYLVALTPAPEPTAAADTAPVHSVANDAWKKPDEVVSALRLQAGQTVYDIGAGSGVFTRRFAQAVGPTGRAIGLDVDSSAVSAMKQDAAAQGLANYEARVVRPDNPAIPDRSADVIFLSNAYHHIEGRVAYFSRLRAALKPGGRLAIVDFTVAGGGSGMPGHVDEAGAEAELVRAGYRLSRKHAFLERQFFIEFVVAR